MSSPEKSRDRSGFANGWSLRVPVALTAGVRNRGKGAKEIQGGRSCDLELGGRPRERQDRQGAHQGRGLQRIRPPCEQGRPSICDQERQDRSRRSPQGGG